MASDGIILSLGTEDGPELPVDLIAGVSTPISKLAHGGFDSVTLVSSASGLPVAQQGTWNIATVTAVTDITNTVTVDGTVTAELGATDNAVLDAIAASVAAIDLDATTIIGHVDGLEALIGTTNTTLTTIDGRVDGIEGLLTTIDGDTGNMATSLDLLDDTVRSEDTATGAGHRGLAVLSVRRDADTSLVDTDGDYAFLQVNATGQLKVAVVSGTVDLGATDNAVLDAIAASVAAIDTDTSTLITAAQLLDDTVYVDGAAWTDDTSKHLLTGGVYQATPQTVTDGDTAPFLIDANGRLEVVATVEASESASDYAEDSPHTSTDVGAFVLAVRNDARTPLAADGDYIPFSTGADGALHVFDETTFDAVDSTVTLLQGISDFTSYLENVAYQDDADWTNDTSYHLLTGGLYQSAPQTVTDGDVAPFNITANGALHVAQQGTVVVDLGANNDVTVTGTVTIQDGGNTITVDGTVAVTNAGLTELAAAINGSSQMDVNIAASAATVTVANAGLTELAAAINGSSQMDVNIAASAATVAVSNAGLTELAAAIDTEVQVDIVGALPAGANTIGVVDLGATDNAVLDAIAASVAAIDTDATTIIGHVDGIEALLGTIDTDTGNLAGILTATQLIDDAIYVDDADWTGDTSKHMLTGGVYMATQQTVTDGDVAPFVTDSAGRIRPGAPDIDITAHAKYMKKYYTSTGAATDGIIWSPAAGTRWHITTFYLNVSAAATVTIEDDKSGGDEAIWKGELAANSGVVMNFPPEYPWASGEDAADLIITTTAGNVYVTAVGYEV